MSPHVLIIGAGLAGTAMALALARHSIRSTVFERRAVPQGIGWVLLLAPNAVCVLDKVMGIEQEIRALGYTYNGIELHAAGSSVQYLGTFGTDDRKGITIKRPVLHAKLLELCEKEELVTVKFGKRLVGVEEGTDSVKAVFEDGTEEGDILLGVDGIHSTVRRHILGDSPSQFTGNVVVGGIIRRSELNLQGIHPPAFLNSPAGTILAFPTDPEGTEIQWATFLSAEEATSWDEYKSTARDQLRANWKDITVDPIRPMIDSLSSDNTLLWAPYQIPRLSTWHTERVCLVGDSAHAISPSIGQGTAQALEDVGLLAMMLGAHKEGDYGSLFQRYEEARKRRLEVVRRIADSALLSRAPSTSYATWWAKKAATRVGLWLLGMMGSRSSFLAYDVTSETVK